MQLTTYRILGPERIAIVGAGEFGKQAAHHILQNDKDKHRFDIAGWYDDTIVKGSVIDGIPVLGTIDKVISDYYEGKFEHVFIAIGYNHLEFKNSLIQKFKDKIPLFNIISPNAHVDASAQLGENIFIYPGAIVDKDVRLGDGVTVNLGSIVSHNSNIGVCSFIAPGVTIAGFSNIGKSSFIGVGSVIKDGVTTCDRITLGAGCVVVKNITEMGTYVGIPAKLLNK